MKTFQDNAGRTWTVAIHAAAIKQVRSLLGLNLLEAIEGKLVERFMTDPILACDVLYVLCKQEADARGISDEEFGRAMAGDALEHGTQQMLEELVDFFPQAKRPMLAKAIAKLNAFQAKAIETANKRLDDPALDRHLEQILQGTEFPFPETMPGGSSGDSPELSASIPGR